MPKGIPNKKRQGLFYILLQEEQDPEGGTRWSINYNRSFRGRVFFQHGTYAKSKYEAVGVGKKWAERYKCELYEE